MGRRVVALIGGALAIASLGIGCGGGEELATATVAKPAYMERLAQICQNTYDTVEEGYEKFKEENGEDAFKDLDSMKEYTDSVLLPAREKQADEIRELGAPKGDERKVAAILDAYASGNEEAAEDPENAVTGVYGPWVPATELVREYGAEGCKY
jgi:hypothetical protein